MKRLLYAKRVVSMRTRVTGWQDCDTAIVGAARIQRSVKREELQERDRKSRRGCGAKGKRSTLDVCMALCMQWGSLIATGGERGDAEGSRQSGVELNRLARSPSRRRGDSRTRAHLPGLSGVCLHLLRVEPDTVAPATPGPADPRASPASFSSLQNEQGPSVALSFVHTRRGAPYAGAVVHSGTVQLAPLRAAPLTSATPASQVDPV